MSADSDPHLALVEVLRLQLIANEQLVLAAVRAHEEIDQALENQQLAEQKVGELRSREDSLQSAATFRERLLEIVGGDLRAPLQQIVQVSEHLARHDDLGLDAKALAARIVETGSKMSNMIEQLVDYTRARGRGTFSLDESLIDFGHLAGEVAARLRETSAIEIRTTQQGNVLGGGDRDRLEHALSNVIGNAAECAEPGTPVLVHCRAEEPNAIVVQISNRGACVPADRLATIFGAFQRGELNGNAGFAHLGLGLVIAAQVAATHGGRLDVQSAEGLTTFTFHLPRRVVPAPSR